MTEYLILNTSLIQFKCWGEKACKNIPNNTPILSRKLYKGENVQQCEIKLMNSAINDNN